MTMAPDVLLPPAPQKRRWKTQAVVIAALAGLVIGAGAGVAGQNAAPTTSAAPEACLQALDIAAQIFDFSSQAMAGAARGFDAASNFDVEGIQAAGNDISAAGDKITNITPAWQSARDECQGVGS